MSNIYYEENEKDDNRFKFKVIERKLPSGKILSSKVRIFKLEDYIDIHNRRPGKRGPSITNLRGTRARQVYENYINTRRPTTRLDEQMNKLSNKSNEKFEGYLTKGQLERRKITTSSQRDNWTYKKEFNYQVGPEDKREKLLMRIKYQLETKRKIDKKSSLYHYFDRLVRDYKQYKNDPNYLMKDIEEFYEAIKSEYDISPQKLSDRSYISEIWEATIKDSEDNSMEFWENPLEYYTSSVMKIMKFALNASNYINPSKVSLIFRLRNREEQIREIRGLREMVLMRNGLTIRDQDELLSDLNEINETGEDFDQTSLNNIFTPERRFRRERINQNIRQESRELVQLGQPPLSQEEAQRRIDAAMAINNEYYQETYEGAEVDFTFFGIKVYSPREASMAAKIHSKESIQSTYNNLIYHLNNPTKKDDDNDKNCVLRAIRFYLAHIISKPITLKDSNRDLRSKILKGISNKQDDGIDMLYLGRIADFFGIYIWLYKMNADNHCILRFYGKDEYNEEPCKLFFHNKHCYLLDKVEILNHDLENKNHNTFNVIASDVRGDDLFSPEVREEQQKNNIGWRKLLSYKEEQDYENMDEDKQDAYEENKKKELKSLYNSMNRWQQILSDLEKKKYFKLLKASKTDKVQKGFLDEFVLRHKKRYNDLPRRDHHFIFDFETIFGTDFHLQNYACGIFDLGENLLNLPEEYPYTLYYDKVITTYKSKCLIEMMNYLEAAVRKIEESLGPKVDIYLWGFNNSRFDNFLLAEEYAKALKLSEWGFLYVKNSILSMRLKPNIIVKDLCRFVNVSLKDACEGYKTVPTKQEGFSHDFIQNIYNEGKLDEWLDNKVNFDKVDEYLKRDVLSSASLLVKVNKAYNKLTKYSSNDTNFEGHKIMNYATLGGLCWTFFLQTIQNKYELVIPHTYEDNLFFRDTLYAGRSDVPQEYIKLENVEVALVDAKSLYPTAMAYMKNIDDEPNKKFVVKWPHSDYKETDKFIEGKLGFYICDVGKQPERNIIPKRDLTLNWSFAFDQKQIKLNSVDILTLKEFGTEVKIYNGYYFENDCDDLFDTYMNNFEKEKTNQDKLKKVKDPNYNPALREGSKSCMVILSGKVAEQYHFEEYKLMEEVNKLKEFRCDVTEESFKYDLLGHLFMAYGERDHTSYKKEKAKPCYLASLIYSYSRRYMYKKILSKYKYFMTDTDSALMLKSEYDKFVKENEQLAKGVNFGDFEQELPTKDSNGDWPKVNVICNDKKNYIISPIDRSILFDPKEKSVDKIRLKGINKKDTWLKEDECKELIERAKIYRKKKAKGDDIHNMYYCLGMDIRELRLINKRPINYEMYEEVQKGNTVYVLTSHIKKHNNIKEAQNVGKAFYLEQIYSIKEVKRHDLQDLLGNETSD